MPGLLCDAGLWRHQLHALSPVADCAVADLTLDDSLEVMAARLMEGLPRQFSVVALSMGGYVAFELLRQAPGRVMRLCLMDTSARPDTTAAARRRRGLMALVARGGRFHGVTPRLLADLLHPDRIGDAALVHEISGMADRLGKAVYLRQQAAILARPDSRPDLPGIRVPTLVAVGEADALTPPALASEIAAGIPGALLRTMAGAGHLPPLEQPEQVSAMLLEWLGATSATLPAS
ncbi:MAG TPA: alpha/beta fold hydrolase [Acetobacteraceae bacterium]